MIHRALVYHQAHPTAGASIASSPSAPIAISPATTSSTFLAQALELQAQGELPWQGVVHLVLEMVLAGTDTSSVTLSWLPVAMRVRGAVVSWSWHDVP